MEKRTEETLRHLFGAPEPPQSLAVRPAPLLRAASGGPFLSDTTLAVAVNCLRIWLGAAEIVEQAKRSIVLLAEEEEAMQKCIDSCDDLLEKLRTNPESRAARRVIVGLRDKYEAFQRQRVLARQALTRKHSEAIVAALEITRTFQPVVEKLLKFSAKLCAFGFDLEEISDHFEAIEFGREIAQNLAG